MSKIKDVIMPICEVCDRYTISILKHSRLTEEQANKEHLRQQIETYQKGINWEDQELVKLVEELQVINGEMWDTEHDIRKGLDNNLGLLEIGKRAIHIRDVNKKRIQIKNEITRHVNQPQFADVKMNHASS